MERLQLCYVRLGQVDLETIKKVAQKFKNSIFGHFDKWPTSDFRKSIRDLTPVTPSNRSQMSIQISIKSRSLLALFVKNMWYQASTKTILLRLACAPPPWIVIDKSLFIIPYEIFFSRHKTNDMEILGPHFTKITFYQKQIFIIVDILPRLSFW